MTERRNARQRFPAGLTQPVGCARFSVDALLLAAFAAHTLRGLPPPKRGPFLELGCGAGAALLAVALLQEDSYGVGVEQAPPLTNAARENTLHLELTDRLTILDGFLPERETLRRCRELLATYPQGRKGASLVLANPPYGEEGDGRASSSALADMARRGSDGTLHDFCFSATRVLCHKGFFCCIYDARVLSRLFKACSENHLGIRRLLPVHPRIGTPARRILLEARRDASHDIALEEALYLHPSDHDTGTRWTAQALSFCPFLEGSP